MRLSAKSFRPYIRVLSYCRPYAGRLGAALASMVLSALFGVIPPWLIKNVVDDVLLAGNGPMLNALSLLLIGLYALKVAFGYANTYLMGWVAQKTIMDIRLALYDKTQRLSLSELYRHRTGEFLSRITNDVASLQNILASTVIELVIQTVTFVGIITLLLVLNWRLTLFAFAAIPFAAFAIDRASSKLRRVGADIQEQLAQLAATAQEALSSVRIVRAFATEEMELERFSRQSRTHFSALVRGTQTRGILEGLVELILIAALALILWLGGRDVLGGRLSVGELLAFLMYLGLLVQPVRVISRDVGTIQQGIASAERIFEILDEPGEVREADSPVVLADMRGEIVFDDVSFSYGPDMPVLRGVSFRAAPGERIAIVGPTGAGKSTAADLLLRFYDPTGGRVLIDGVDLRELDLKSFRRRVGVVPQDPVLMKGSFSYNISYGMDGATDGMIRDAAVTAGIDGFIMSLPGGYGAEIGERGVTLSGGQRQRVAIARAIVRDPAILIMDEATSSLDTETEAHIQSAMRGAARGRTSIVIAHRLSTIRDADRIIVLDGGRVAEEGTHEELTALRGKYYNLCRLQGGEEDA